MVKAGIPSNIQGQTYWGAIIDIRKYAKTPTSGFLNDVSVVAQRSNINNITPTSSPIKSV
jgi:hypothetical protein